MSLASRILVGGGILGITGVFLGKFLETSAVEKSPSNEVYHHEPLRQIASSRESRMMPITDASMGQAQTFPARLKEILAGDPEKKEEALRQFMRAWVAVDPLQAALFAEAVEPPTLRDDMVRLLLEAWGQKDSKSALAWAVKISSPSERQTSIAEICAQIMNADPQTALQLALHYNFGDDHSGLLEDLTQQWANLDLSAAYSWVNSQPENELKDRLNSRLAFVWAKTDPVNAAYFVVEKMLPGEVQTESAISVLYQWAMVEPAGAMAWAEHFPQGALRDRAIQEVANAAQYRSPGP